VSYLDYVILFSCKAVSAIVLDHFWAILCCTISPSYYYDISCCCLVLCMFSFTMHFYYHVNLPKGRVYTDTRLGLESVALLAYPY